MLYHPTEKNVNIVLHGMSYECICLFREREGPWLSLRSWYTRRGRTEDHMVYTREEERTIMWCIHVEEEQCGV